MASCSRLIWPGQWRGGGRLQRGLARVCGNDQFARMARPKSALIVDDEPHVRTYVKLILAQLGITDCHQAGNLEQAREEYDACQPELVMLDINLQGNSGLELLREIRAIDPETCIIMLSAAALSTTVREALDAGADGFLRKDLPRAKIVEQLEEIFAEEP